MTDPFTRLRRFLRELKRRSVYKVAATYAVVGFVLIQAANLIFPALNIPSWAYSLVVVLILFGFPIALIVAWAFEMSPEGVRRTPKAEGEVAEPAPGGAGGWIAALMVVLVAGGGFWYLTSRGGEEPAEKKAAATDTAQASGATAVSAMSRDRPFVAVLPLENLSPSEENRFFADGIHEEILSQLSKVSGLGVFGRTTMRQYADTDRSVHEIGRELNAQAVLEGSVRRAGDRVRITTQLIDSDSRDHLWSETYERELSPEQIFDIQADIAGQVASALETELTEEERQRIADAPTSDLAAYDAYLEGRSEVRQFYATLNLDQIDRAIDRFRDALRHDPNFADAHARLADAYRMRYTWHSSDQRWLDSTEVALERARATDRSVPQVHWVQGFVYTNQDSLEAAAAAFRRALDLEPSNAIACSGLSTVRSLQGQLAESVRWAHRAYRLEPDWSFRLGEMGIRLEDIGMLDAAAAWYERVREMDPENASGVWDLTHLYLSQGEVGRARETVESYRSRAPDHPIGYRLAAEIALHRGQAEEARRLLERRVEAPGRVVLPWLPPERMLHGLVWLRSGDRESGRRILRAATDSLREELDERTSGWDQLALARGLAALGQDDDALEHLREAMKRGRIRHQAHRVDPFFETLRSNPRFEGILRQMEVKQKEFREQVRRMDLDLYPPGAEPDRAS